MAEHKRVSVEGAGFELTVREYALISAAVAAFALAILPLLLRGVRVSLAPLGPSLNEPLVIGQ